MKLLNDGGATVCNYCMTSTTHLVCGSGFDENECAQATDLYDVPCVTQRWVVASVQLGRLAALTAYNPTANRLFSKMVAAITQVPVADRFRLYALITYHGGQVDRQLTPATTHLICGAAVGHAYAKSFTIKKESFAIVTPDWVMDSLQAAALLDPVKYHPKLLVKPKPAAAAIIQKFSKLTAAQPTATSTPTTPAPAEPTISTNSNPVELDKQMLSSILGFDCDDDMDGKSSDMAADHDDMQVLQVPSSLPTQILQTQLSAPASSSAPATPSTASSSHFSRQMSQPQTSQLSQQLQAPQQPMAGSAGPMQSRQTPNKQSGAQLVRSNSGSQIIATQAAIQQQITAINQQHQLQQQQQKLAAANAAGANAKVSSAAVDQQSGSVTPPEQQQQQGRQSQTAGGQPVQIITQVCDT